MDSKIFAALVAAISLCAPAAAQEAFATAVVDYLPGPGVLPTFADPATALHGPRGCGISCGALDVVTLGVGGQLTLGFDVVIQDGPGADLIVYENPFQADEAVPPGTFTEVVFVEVSSGGPFARFPSDYGGGAGPFSPYANFGWGAYDGLASAVPTLANVRTNTIDPLNPTVAGGTAFDLAHLANDPLVLAGRVNLKAITRVRLVDCVGGIDVDSNGDTIWDSGGSSGSADIDAVSVINYRGLVDSQQPTVDLHVDAQDRPLLSISDPDGLLDLDPNTLLISINLVPLSWIELLQLGVLTLESATPESVVLRVNGSLGHSYVLAASIEDLDGHFSTDQLMVK
ncbi:hypothetical protein Pla163_35720 [Planctomycetes bacterium Pla163]|uniref:Uncharacterized protein n=1 Tax=Rohdeia mirabilis TaxID=2528008 RepID=A0A518D4L7_9BACT|nr:hypothetical protein Pla163_35720 [Planctomycetes bacterium Pla163]